MTRLVDVTTRIDALREQIASIPFSHAETSFRVSIWDILAKASEHRSVGESARGFERLLSIGTASNLGTLCLYLQGDSRRALALTRDRRRRLAESAHPEARCLTIQPLINEVRLLRASGLYDEARRSLDALEREATVLISLGLEDMLDKQTGVRDGTRLQAVVSQVGFGERLKCLWGEGRLQECITFAQSAPPGVELAREYLLRCWLESGAYDRVIGWCYENAGGAPWSVSYAACALIRGNALEEAGALTDAPGNTSAESQLRLATEWANCGHRERARECAERAVDACDERDEVFRMLSLSLAGLLSDDARSIHFGVLWGLIEKSLHTPTRVVCLSAVHDAIGLEARLVGRALLDCVDERLLLSSSAAADFRELNVDYAHSSGLCLRLQREAMAAVDRISSWCEDTHKLLTDG